MWICKHPGAKTPVKKCAYLIMTIQENSRKPVVYSIMFNSFRLKMILCHNSHCDTLIRCVYIIHIYKIIQFANMLKKSDVPQDISLYLNSSIAPDIRHPTLNIFLKKHRWLEILCRYNTKLVVFDVLVIMRCAFRYAMI